MADREAAPMRGFADQPHLSRRFRHLVGSSPKDYRRMNAQAPQQHVTGSIYGAITNNLVGSEKCVFLPATLQQTGS
jgi:AraC-like DNA-binding protein